MFFVNRLYGSEHNNIYVHKKNDFIYILWWKKELLSDIGNIRKNPIIVSMQTYAKQLNKCKKIKIKICKYQTRFSFTDGVVVAMCSNSVALSVINLAISSWPEKVKSK